MTRSLQTLAGAAAAALTLAFALPAAAQSAPTATPVPSDSFKRADANGDGKLSKEEAAKVPAIAAKFDELDKDKDGSLSMNEFMAGYQPTGGNSKP